jgi:hypothetical protein
MAECLHILHDTLPDLVKFTVRPGFGALLSCLRLFILSLFRFSPPVVLLKILLCPII